MISRPSYCSASPNKIYNFGKRERNIDAETWDTLFSIHFLIRAKLKLLWWVGPDTISKYNARLGLNLQQIKYDATFLKATAS